MRCPRGIIFDFDGVLVDTEWAIYQSWVQLYAREGQQISIATYSPCLGAGYSHWNPADHLEKLTGKKYDWEVETPARQAVLEADLARAGLMDGALELLDWCAEQGIGLTVASSSSRRWVQGWLERLGIYERFDGVFTRTDGYAVKPDPALFLAARNCLNLPKEDCLIVEDTENGTISARNAGIPCVAVPNRMTESCDLSRAQYRVASLRALLTELKSAQ
ncbi:MAG: HAD-IA family hydrolase [Akkermansia sp.]|nr:HAD-IA family hydrolase [Akkermansia sp.]